MRCRVIPAAKYAFHFCQFVHEPLLILQPPGRVREQHVDVTRARGVPGIEDHGSRVGARLLRYNRHIIALAPGLQLLDRRGPKRVASRKHYRQAGVPEAFRQLADRRRLAGAVDADHQDDERAMCGADVERLRNRLENCGQGPPQAFAQCVDVFEFLAREALLQRSDNPLGGLDADIGHDQFGLEIIEHVFVDLAAWCKIGEIIGQPAVTPIQSRPQFPEEALARLGTILVRRHRFSKSPVGGESPTLSG